MKVLTALQIKNAEKSAVNNGLFSYAQMMKNAGNAVFDEIDKRYEIAGKRFLIIAGRGNNGGDGLVIANRLNDAGAFVSICFPLGKPDTETARIFLDAIDDSMITDTLDGEYDYYIDALFGIGLDRMLTDEIAYLIDTLNQKIGIKIAVDIPSGVFADGGMAQAVFVADLTVTFIGYKLSEVLPPTSSFCGEVVLKTLDIDTEKDFSYNVIDAPVPEVYDKNSHKGTFGTALLICGSYGMCGAEILAAKAAVTSGAGIVKAIVCDKNYTAFTQSVPEAVTIPVQTSSTGAPVLFDETVFSALSDAKSLLIGCGLGTSDDAKAAVKKALLYTNIPTVVDADGINVISGDISILKNVNSSLILTPHPGEMARLLDTTVADIQSHRVFYARKFALEYGCVLVLKGANTIVALPDGNVYFNMTGNYGMAKGGSGDILAGIITALLACGYDPLKATLTAVYVHGIAGDNAARKYTKRTMTPSDILEELKFISF